MKRQKVTLLSCAICLISGILFGGFYTKRFLPKVSTPRGSSRAPMPADLIILGRVTAIEEAKDSSDTVYKVSVLRVIRGDFKGDTIHVKLLTLVESNESYYPAKVPITKATFEGLFVLNRSTTSSYDPQWIVPEEAFQWTPAPGLLEFIAERFQLPETLPRSQSPSR